MEGMDPVTAIFSFLSTPVGQLVAAQLVQVETRFVGMIGDLVSVVHAKNVPQAPPVQPVAA
jgi:hypothetical protein